MTAHVKGTSQEDSDERLMLRFCAGDSGAFAVLLQRYQRPIHAFVARYLGPSQAPLAER